MRADRIFVHAWWRSGSTYVWSKLREDDSLVCYYEPLDERVARLTYDRIEQPHVIEKSRALRHPPKRNIIMPNMPNFSAPTASAFRRHSPTTAFCSGPTKRTSSFAFTSAA